MASINDRLPTPLSERLAALSSAIYSRQGREVDVAIGGVPFQLATYSEIPQSVATIEVRKDQFDAEQDPGEQSLTGWWRRSQSSWHEGAGNLYQEDSTQAVASSSFYTSSGVDVFTPGRFTLLKRMDMNANASNIQFSRAKPYAANSVRTNLCTNPSFETNTTGWAPGDGGTPADLPTVTRDTTKFFTGAASGRLDWATDDATGNPPQLAVPTQVVAANAQFTAQLKVWVPTGSVAVRLVSNSVLGTSSGATKDAWVTITVTSTADGSGNLNLVVWPVTPAGVGQKFYADSCLAELSGVVGAYFDGSSPNSVWTGTVNNSTSTETITAADVSISAVGTGALYTGTTPSSAPTSLHAPGGKTIVDGVITGANFYDIASDGTLYAGAVSAPGSATTWPCGGAPTRLAWGKHRLWVIGGRSLWQPNVNAAGGTSQNPIFTNPNQGWTYTCMAEGPSAMYFGGHDGNTSTIQAVTLDSGGALPTLTGASVTAVLPDGELVQEIAILAGQFIGIGTNRGFRVGNVGTSGSLTYGPLLIEPTDVTGCTAIGTQGKFFLVAFRVSGGTAVAYRIDTSNELDTGIFPYAEDISLGHTGWITSLASVTSTRLVATGNDGQLWNQSATNYVATGYLQTGRVRYRTNELKAFKFLSVEVEPLTGTVAVDLIKEGGSTLPVGSITTQGEVSGDQFGISTERMRYASVKFTLIPTSAGTAAPVINSYLLKALPAVAPQRLITLPLKCYDKETSRSGQVYGGKGYAKDRLTSLQVLEDLGDTVVFQDYSSTSSGGQTVTIESVNYVQTSPGSPHADGKAGGIIILKLRTVA